MDCLSGIQCSHQPTDEEPVCKPCREAHERYRERSIREETDRAIRWLTSRGYKIEPPEIARITMPRWLRYHLSWALSWLGGRLYPINKRLGRAVWQWSWQVQRNHPRGPWQPTNRRCEITQEDK